MDELEYCNRCYTVRVNPVPYLGQEEKTPACPVCAGDLFLPVSLPREQEGRDD